MSNNEKSAILDVILACDATILATCDDDTPDARHISNIMNKNATTLDLFFMTSRDTPKYAQLQQNPECALYYFDDKTRHAVRLYGKMMFVDDATVRAAHWRPEFEKFGYGGPDNPEFILMRFVPHKYKYYIGPEMRVDKI